MHLPLLFAIAAILSSQPARAQSLADRVTPLISAHEGKVAVAVKHLKTGESFTHDADEPMPTASLIKLPVMVEAYRQAAEGKLDLAEQITLNGGGQSPRQRHSDARTSPAAQRFRSATPSA